MLTILWIFEDSKITSMKEGGEGVMEVRIDKDLIGEEGSGWNEITVLGRQRDVLEKQTVCSMQGATNEELTGGTRVIDTACIFTRCIVLESGNGSTRSYPRNFQFAPLCI